jgi:hypothetical protein
MKDKIIEIINTKKTKEKSNIQSTLNKEEKSME